MLARATLRAMPARLPMRKICAPRSRAAGSRASPISSASQDGGEARDRPFQREVCPDQSDADDDRQPPVVYIGEYPGGHLEDEDGGFEDGAHQDQLQGVESDDLHLVHAIGRERSGQQQTQEGVGGQVERVGGKSSHVGTVSIPRGGKAVATGLHEVLRPRVRTVRAAR